MPVFSFHRGGSLQRSFHSGPQDSSSTLINTPGERGSKRVGPGPCPPEAHSLLRDTAYPQHIHSQGESRLRYTCADMYTSRVPAVGRWHTQWVSKRRHRKGSLRRWKHWFSARGFFFLPGNINNIWRHFWSYFSYNLGKVSYCHIVKERPGMLWNIQLYIRLPPTTRN